MDFNEATTEWVRIAAASRIMGTNTNSVYRLVVVHGVVFKRVEGGSTVYSRADCERVRDTLLARLVSQGASA